MIVYLKVNIVERCESRVAFNSVSFSPSMVWRYSNYQEGLNYFRTYMHKGFMRSTSSGYSIGII